MQPTPDDLKVDILAESRLLLDAWCNRHLYHAVYTLWSGFLAFNGLTDGNHEFLQALQQLRTHAKSPDSGITQPEAEKIHRLIGVASRRLNST